VEDHLAGYLANGNAPHADIQSVEEGQHGGSMAVPPTEPWCSDPLEDGQILCNPKHVYKHMICIVNVCECENGFPHGAYVTGGDQGREKCLTNGQQGACSGCNDGYVMSTPMGSNTLGTCSVESLRWQFPTRGGGSSTWGGSAFCNPGEYGVGACGSGFGQWCVEGGENHYYQIQCKEMKYKTDASYWNGDELWAIYPSGSDPKTSHEYGQTIQCDGQQNILAVCSSGSQNKDCLNPNGSEHKHSHRALCKANDRMIVSNTCNNVYGGDGEHKSCAVGQVMTSYCESGNNRDCGSDSRITIKCCDFYWLNPQGNNVH